MNEELENRLNQIVKKLDILIDKNTSYFEAQINLARTINKFEKTLISQYTDSIDSLSDAEIIKNYKELKPKGSLKRNLSKHGYSYIVERFKRLKKASKNPGELE